MPLKLVQADQIWASPFYKMATALQEPYRLRAIARTTLEHPGTCSLPQTLGLRCTKDGPLPRSGISRAPGPHGNGAAVGTRTGADVLSWRALAAPRPVGPGDRIGGTLSQRAPRSLGRKILAVHFKCAAWNLRFFLAERLTKR